MKITKARLKQIIREELNESEYYDDEGENDASWGQVSAQAAHDLTKGAPVNALLQALRVVAAPTLDATIRRHAYDVVKGLEEADFNDFVKALEDAIASEGEGY